MTSPVDDPDQQQQPPPSDALNRRYSIITDDAAASTDYEDDHDDSIYDEARKHPLERRMTNDANAHPGDVRINVKGAFIVEPPIEEMQEQLGLLDAKLGANDSAGRAPISRESSSLASGQQTPTPGDRFDEEGYMHDPKDIRLPFHKSVVSHIALDIGGSLAKLVYFSHEQDSSGVSLGGRLNFLKFETEKIDVCIEFMKKLKQKHIEKFVNGERRRQPLDLCVMATGGGAYKYYDRIKEALGVEVLREDEMECLIIGLDFFISEIPCEVFTYSETNPMEFTHPTGDHIYPYLLVNIGSGVSMIKVTGPREYTRVGGTSLGGGTLWGILSLLTGARNFEEMLAMAERGDNTAVDMLVGDIYGTDYNKIGLKSSTIASSFGKVYRMKRQAERDAEDHGGLANGDAAHTPRQEFPPSADDGINMLGGMGFSSTQFDPLSSSTNHHAGSSSSQISFRPEDVSRSLLYAISNNIGQIAFLHAERHQCKDIYFGGSFIGGHWQTMATLSYAIRFWSTREDARQEKKAYFLRHEGYLGAVGAFLKRKPRGWGRRGSLDFGNAGMEGKG